MDPVLRELLDLFGRWIHLIAGIMWIGNSMLFNWLDRNLIKKTGGRSRSFGEIWLLHSGAYYQVEKTLLAPHELPTVLHWFKWQSYTTWLSGFFLMAVVYYLGDKSFLVDPQVMELSYGAAIGLSLSVLAGGFLLYDGLWRTLGKRSPDLATALTLALVATAMLGLTHVFTARAAYIHVGALLGTLMAGNVFFHIIPSQKQMVAATVAGEEADVGLSTRAKTRSIHNNYITFPVLFIMLSNHFPSTWGHAHAGLVLLWIALGGATVRHFLNIRFTFQRWLPALLSTIAITVLGVWWMFQPPPSAAQPAPTSTATAGGAGEHVAFPVVKAIIDARCVPCHAAHPVDPAFAAAPAGGMIFDSPEKLKAMAERIKYRAVVTRTMPLVNKTGITPQERELLGRWVDEGARLDP